MLTRTRKEKTHEKKTMKANAAVVRLEWRNERKRESTAKESRVVPSTIDLDIGAGEVVAIDDDAEHPPKWWLFSITVETLETHAVRFGCLSVWVQCHGIVGGV